MLLCRVSIQHVNFHRPFRLKTDKHLSSAVGETVCQENDVKVYPISSEGGCVIYHIGSSLLNTEEDLQSYGAALTSGTDHTEDVMSENCIDASNLDFSSDTFGSRHSLDKHPSSYSSVQQHFCDETVQDTCSNDSSSGHDVSDSADSIVNSVIDDIIDEAISRCLNVESGLSVQKQSGSVCSPSQCTSSGLDFEDDMPSETCRRHDGGVDGVPVTSDTSSPTSPGDASPTLHPLCAHILLYVRKFDANRALYALGCLHAIVSTSPNVVVRSLTTSNVGGASTPRATQLQSLLVQHRRSVLGRRFCADDTESGASGIRSSMFIDVLVTISLYYVRGCFPNLLAPRLTTRDIADNVRLQVRAADILTTVLDELAVTTRSGGRGFATYIFDLLDKCKVRF